jgi:hypothetical protein
MTNDGMTNDKMTNDRNDQRADEHFSPNGLIQQCGLFGDPKGLCRISPSLMNFKKFVQTSHYGGLAT